jgi:uncharacterized protein YcgL (UPF0745 family)
MKICTIYKSTKKDEMYLYVIKSEGVSRVPEALLAMFGKPVHVTDMLLKPERRLARADIVKVLEELDSKGFYLQMPPPKEDYLLDLYNPDDSKYRDSGLLS